jgi:hypothetical protein
MPRIIVTTEQSKRPDAPVLLDEWVYPEHLCDEHAAAQLVERIGWAVNDATEVESRLPRHARRRRTRGETAGHR